MLRKPCVKVYLGLLAAVIIVNIIAWNSAAFCDWYIANIFPIWVNTYGRITGALPFSLGEWLLMAGVLIATAAVLLAVVLLVRLLILAVSGKRIFRKIEWAKRAYCGFAWIVLGVLCVMTLNCTILYHGSTFNEKYFGKMDRDYTLEELIAVRNYVVEKCNAISQQMVRDEDGTILYEGDMAEQAIRAMQYLGESYDGLKGFYPRPKPMLFSDLMCQQYMQGYYFPFSMEANYNDVMYIMNKPSTLCHELAHLKGYIYEDEANFIGFLACVESEDKLFEYSGYLSVLNYLDNDFYRAVGRDNTAYFSQPQILPQVHTDNVFVVQEEWDRINKKAIIDTEVVEAVSDSITETTLKWNGVADGMFSYNRVVKLLLQYYEDILN